MPDDVKRFFRICLLLGALAIISVIALVTDSIKDRVTVLLYPSIVFVPIAYVMNRYKSYILSNKYNKFTVTASIIGMALAAIIIRKTPALYMPYIVVLGFEITCLLYILLKNNYYSRNTK